MTLRREKESVSHSVEQSKLVSIHLWGLQLKDCRWHRTGLLKIQTVTLYRAVSPLCYACCIGLPLLVRGP